MLDCKYIWLYTSFFIIVFKWTFIWSKENDWCELMTVWMIMNVTRDQQNETHRRSPDSVLYFSTHCLTLNELCRSATVHTLTVSLLNTDDHGVIPVFQELQSSICCLHHHNIFFWNDGVLSFIRSPRAQQLYMTGATHTHTHTHTSVPPLTLKYLYHEHDKDHICVCL